MDPRKLLRVPCVIRLGGWLLLAHWAACGGPPFEAPLSAAQGQGDATAAPRQSPAVAEIRQALASTTELHFEKTPLEKAVACIAGRHKLQIRLDNTALRDAGVKLDTPITRSLKGISLRSALRLILDELRLAYLVKDESLVITSREKAESTLRTAVYPVADLVLSPRWDRDQGGPDFDSLIDLITANLKPTAWDTVGGPGSIAPFENRLCLVVNQTDDMHEAIAALLERLRRIPRAGPAGAAAPGGTPKEALPLGMPLGNDGPAETRIRQALASPTTWDFDKRPLGSVVDVLKERYKIEIQIDGKALDSVGVSAGTPITKSVQGISLRSALHSMLDELGLAYLIKHEVLLITTPEAAEGEGEEEVVVYPVADLVFPADYVDIPGRSGPDVADFDPLIELITSTVRPTSWPCGSVAPISPFANRVCIVVSQMQDVHEEIAELLQKLRSVPPTRRSAPSDPSRVLQCVAETDFDKVPLYKLLEYLRQRYRIEIELDQKAIRAVGVRPDTLLAGHVVGVGWRSGLRELLGKLKLDFIVKNRVLLVTSQDRAAKELVTVVYPVSDLVAAGDNFKSLLDVVTATVRPKSWSSKGGPGAVTVVQSRDCLVVSQTQDVHEEIAELLEKLRQTNNPWGVPARASPFGRPDSKPGLQPATGPSRPKPAAFGQDKSRAFPSR